VVCWAGLIAQLFWTKNALRSSIVLEFLEKLGCSLSTRRISAAVSSSTYSVLQRQHSITYPSCYNTSNSTESHCLCSSFCCQLHLRLPWSINAGIFHCFLLRSAGQWWQVAARPGTCCGDGRRPAAATTSACRSDRRTCTTHCHIQPPDHWAHHAAELWWGCGLHTAANRRVHAAGTGTSSSRKIRLQTGQH
jgi:hypothetical protein